MQRVCLALASVELWVVACLTVASVLAERLLPVAVLGAGLCWIFRWLGSGAPTRRTPADWPIGLLLLLLPVTLQVTAWPEITWPQVYRLLSGVTLFYAIVNWSTAAARMRLLTAGIVLLGLGLAAGATISVLWPAVSKLPIIPEDFYTRFVPLVRDTVNPNVMAGSLVIVLPSVIALVLFGWSSLGWISRLLTVVIAMVMVAMLVLTQSRGGMLALGSALCALVILRWRFGWILVSGGVALSLIAYRWIGSDTILHALLRKSLYGEWAQRRDIWLRATFMIEDFSFTGIGMGTFRQVTDLIYPLAIPSPGIPHAHNLLLQVAVDLGLPGLIFWLAILLVVFQAAWQTYRAGRRAGDGWVAGLGAGLLSGQIALLVHGLIDAVTWGMVRPAVIVWALWGIAVAGQQIYVHEHGIARPTDHSTQDDATASRQGNSVL